MAYLLNIETATKNCSVALTHKGTVIALAEECTENFAHAEKLHVLIDEVLKKSELSINALNAVAVSCGPGSYTGLRIGVSAAKGLCYALGIPLISVDTLAILAQELKIENGNILPVIDARRMEVYTSFFDRNHRAIRETKAEIIDESSYSEITETLHLIGDGAPKFKNVLTDKKFVFHDTIRYPSAEKMSTLSFQKYQQSDFEDTAYFEPFYLKDFLIVKK